MCGPTQTVESFLNIDDGVAISVLKNVPAFVSIHNHKKKIERGRTKYSPSVSDETLEGLAFSLMASAAVNSQIVRPMSLYRRCDIMTKTRKNQSEPEDGLAQQTQVHSDRQFVRIDNCISEDNLCAVEASNSSISNLSSAVTRGIHSPVIFVRSNQDCVSCTEICTEPSNALSAQSSLSKTIEDKAIQTDGLLSIHAEKTSELVVNMPARLRRRRTRARSPASNAPETVSLRIVASADNDRAGVSKSFSSECKVSSSHSFTSLSTSPYQQRTNSLQSRRRRPLPGTEMLKTVRRILSRRWHRRR